MNEISIKSLKRKVISALGLGMFSDQFYSLLDPESPKDGAEIFKELVIKSIKDYSKSFPLVLETQLPVTREYTFLDNFQLYLDDQLPENYIQLVPIGISYLGVRFKSSFAWRYSRPTLLGLRGALLMGKCSYFAEHPFRIELAGDGEFTEESKIYMIVDGKEEYYYNYLYIIVGERIIELVNSINIGSGIEMLPRLETRISNLKEDKDRSLDSLSRITDMWRK